MAIKYLKVKAVRTTYEVFMDGVLVGKVWDEFGKFWVAEATDGHRHIKQTRKNAVEQMIQFLEVK